MKTNFLSIAFIVPLLTFLPGWGETPRRMKDEEKRESLALALENAEAIVKVAMFEALYRDEHRESGPNYARVYRRAIVVEGLRGPFKAGDYIVIATSFENYPKAMGDVRQEYHRPECRYYLLADGDGIEPPRQDFTGMFAVLNGAPIIDSPTPVIKDREQFIPDVATIEPARLIMKPMKKAEKE